MSEETVSRQPDRWEGAPNSLAVPALSNGERIKFLLGLAAGRSCCRRASGMCRSRLIRRRCSSMKHQAMFGVPKELIGLEHAGNDLSRYAQLKV